MKRKPVELVVSEGQQIPHDGMAISGFGFMNAAHRNGVSSDVPVDPERDGEVEVYEGGTVTAGSFTIRYTPE